MRRGRLLAMLAVAGVVALAPGTVAAGGLCGPVETTPDEGHLHLLGDAPPPVGYRTTPPASGWHYRERDRVRLGVQPPEAPLSEAEQVSILAIGGVVVTYRDLDAAGVAALAGAVDAAAPRPVTLTSYDALERGEVALTAWRRLQRCDGADAAAVAAFVAEHAAAEPDFTMAGGDAPAGGAPPDEPHAAHGGQAQPERLPGAVLVVAGAGAVGMLAAAGWRALAGSPPPPAGGIIGPRSGAEGATRREGPPRLGQRPDPPAGRRRARRTRGR